MKNLTIALFFSLVLGCDAPDTDLGTVTSRDFCEDVPAPGSVGGACFIGYECDAGLTCKVGTIGFVCAETCGSTSGCDCDASCDGGLCAAQCKSSDDCVEGMVCDGYGNGAPTCIWPALAALPQPCEYTTDCVLPGTLCDTSLPEPVCVPAPVPPIEPPTNVCWLSGFTWGPCGLDDQCADGDMCVVMPKGRICAPACDANGCPADLIENCGPGHCTPSGLCIPD